MGRRSMFGGAEIENSHHSHDGAFHRSELTRTVLKVIRGKSRPVYGTVIRRATQIDSSKLVA